MSAHTVSSHPLLADAGVPIPVQDTTTSMDQTTLSVFKNDGVTYVLDPDGATALKHAERSETLAEMPEAQGSSTLPISRDALELWQCGASAALSMNSSWGVARIQDLCTVAQVRIHVWLSEPPAAKQLALIPMGTHETLVLVERVFCVSPTTCLHAAGLRILTGRCCAAMVGC